MTDASYERSANIAILRAVLWVSVSLATVRLCRALSDSSNLNQGTKLFLLSWAAVMIAGSKGSNKFSFGMTLQRAAQLLACVIVALLVAAYWRIPIQSRAYFSAIIGIAVYAFVEESIFREFLARKLQTEASAAVRNHSLQTLLAAAVSTVAFTAGHFVTSSGFQLLLATDVAYHVLRLTVMGFCFWGMYRLRGLMVAAVGHTLINLAVLSNSPFERSESRLLLTCGILLLVVLATISLNGQAQTAARTPAPHL